MDNCILLLQLSAAVRTEKYGSTRSPCILHGSRHSRTLCRYAGICKVVWYHTMPCGHMRCGHWTRMVWCAIGKGPNCTSHMDLFTNESTANCIPGITAMVCMVVHTIHYPIPVCTLINIFVLLTFIPSGWVHAQR